MPAAFELWRRAPVKGARWCRVGQFATHSAAFDAMTGAGDFAIREVDTPAPAPGLFDAPPADTAPSPTQEGRPDA